MRTLQIVSPILVTVLALGFGSGCSGDHGNLPTLTLDQVARIVQNRSATLVDANGQSTRSEYGVIPGAILLSDYHDYDVASELPTDKNAKLAFYCSSTRCSAAPRAAEKAVEAGYTDVAVVPEGIKGWVDAGHATEPAPTT